MIYEHDIISFYLNPQFFICEKKNTKLNIQNILIRLSLSKGIPLLTILLLSIEPLYISLHVNKD